MIDRSYVYPIQVVSFGDDLLMVALAGEVVVDYSINIKAKHNKPDRPLWVSAYANDVFGYVPSTRVLREGGYEGGESFYYSNFPTPLANDTERIIMDEVRRMIDQLADPSYGTPSYRGQPGCSKLSTNSRPVSSSSTCRWRSNRSCHSSSCCTCHPGTDHPSDCPCSCTRSLIVNFRIGIGLDQQWG